MPLFNPEVLPIQPIYVTGDTPFDDAKAQAPGRVDDDTFSLLRDRINRKANPGTFSLDEGLDQDRHTVFFFNLSSAGAFKKCLCTEEGMPTVQNSFFDGSLATDAKNRAILPSKARCDAVFMDGGGTDSYGHLLRRNQGQRIE
jgi:hypothetical protein